MPFLQVESGTEPVEIFYEVFTDRLCLKEHGLEGHRCRTLGGNGDNPPADVVLIMGLSAAQGAWTPQLHGLLDPNLRGENQKIRVLTLDNRGVGRSTSPKNQNAYSTELMAGDVLAILDRLHWDSAHVVGHSMGGMIAARLAANHPARVASLTLVSSTNGRWQALPQKWRSYKLAWKLMTNPSRRANYDLKFHFTKDTLQGLVQGRPRKEALLREYSGIDTAPPTAASAAAPLQSQPQPDCGLHGQLRAVWKHSLSSRELARVKEAPFRKQVIHGRADILAMPKWSETMANRLGCPCIMLRGAHMLTRECGTEINALIRSIIFPPQALPPDHYMAQNAEVEVVSPLCATADLDRVTHEDRRKDAATSRSSANGVSRNTGVNNRKSLMDQPPVRQSPQPDPAGSQQHTISSLPSRAYRGTDNDAAPYLHSPGSSVCKSSKTS